MVYIEIFRADKRTFVNWPNKNAEKQRNVNLINRNTYEQKKKRCSTNRNRNYLRFVVQSRGATFNVKLKIQLIFSLVLLYRLSVPFVTFSKR